MIIEETEARELAEQMLSESDSTGVVDRLERFRSGWLVVIGGSPETPGTSSIVVHDDGKTEWAGSAPPIVILARLNGTPIWR